WWATSSASSRRRARSRGTPRRRRSPRVRAGSGPKARGPRARDVEIDMVQAEATARYVRTSAQKAGLVLDLIRGRAVSQALATLQFTRKSVARDIEKVLRSAIANAQQKDGFGGDVDRLYVSAAYANQGP